MLKSPIQACQCSTGNWLVMIVARVPAWSSITPIQIRPRGPVPGRQRPVGQQQHIVTRHCRQPAREAAVAVQDAQCLSQPWHAQG